MKHSQMSTPTQESPVTAALGRMESPPKQSLRELPDWGPLSASHLAPSLTHNTPCQSSICSGVEVAAGSEPPASSFFTRHRVHNAQEVAYIKGRKRRREKGRQERSLFREKYI